MSEYEFAVVDAFTHEAYGGNPAGVVLNADGLGDEQMQKIAAELNLSETTFVLPPTTPDAAVRFRWFTPSAEVKMCGHATLGGVHAMLEAGRFTEPMRQPGAALAIETLGGRLSVRTFRQDEPGAMTQYWLDLVDPTLTRKAANMMVLARALGIELDDIDQTRELVVTQDDDLIVSVDNFETLMRIRMNRNELIEFSRKGQLRGVCVTTTRTVGPTVTAQSRFFAPAVGIDEDPVTGSVHGPLGAYLVKHEVVTPQDAHVYMECVQVKPGPAGRAGLVAVVVSERDDGSTAVRIGGNCVTTMRGRMIVPD